MKQVETHLIVGHALDRLKELADDSVHCCVTSPPYFGLRDYGTPPQIWGGDFAWRGQLGLEPSPSIVLDPFFGSGTTGLVARRLQRSFIGIDLQDKFRELALERMSK